MIRRRWGDESWSFRVGLAWWPCMTHSREEFVRHFQKISSSRLQPACKSQYINKLLLRGLIFHRNYPVLDGYEHSSWLGQSFPRSRLAQPPVLFGQKPGSWAPRVCTTASLQPFPDQYGLFLRIYLSVVSCEALNYCVNLF